ncbi:MAG TPA: ACT domain-containing protein [Nitriliruptorales bacterium]
MPYRDLVIIPDDTTGVMARIGKALADHDINIEGLSAFTGQGKGVIHVLVDEPEKAHKALAEGGFDVKAMRRVVIIDVEDEPGVLGTISQKLADAGINIQQAYVATGTATATRLVLAVDDVDQAKRVLDLES